MFIDLRSFNTVVSSHKYSNHSADTDILIFKQEYHLNHWSYKSNQNEKNMSHQIYSIYK